MVRCRTARKACAANMSGSAAKRARIGMPHKRSAGSITARMLGKQAKKSAVSTAAVIPLLILAMTAFHRQDSLRLNTSIFSCLPSALVIIPAKQAKINTAWIISRSPSMTGTPPTSLIKKKSNGRMTNMPTRESTNTFTIFLIPLSYSYLRIGATRD